MKIKVFAAFVSLLFIISTVLAGCSNQPATKTTFANGTEKQILRINLGEEPPLLNTVLEGLVRLGSDEKPESVEIQNAPFKIRLQMYKQGDFDVVLTR